MARGGSGGGATFAKLQRARENYQVLKLSRGNFVYLKSRFKILGKIKLSNQTAWKLYRIPVSLCTENRVLKN